jgi:hypothetical protein
MELVTWGSGNLFPYKICSLGWERGGNKGEILGGCINLTAIRAVSVALQGKVGKDRATSTLPQHPTILTALNLTIIFHGSKIPL